jgi:hypothetical protein
MLQPAAHLVELRQVVSELLQLGQLFQANTLVVAGTVFERAIPPDSEHPELD